MLSLRQLFFHAHVSRTLLQDGVVLKLLPLSTVHCFSSTSNEGGSPGDRYEESDIWDRLPSHGRHGSFRSHSSSVRSSEQGRHRDRFYRRSDFHQRGRSDRYRGQFDEDGLFDDGDEMYGRSFKQRSVSKRDRFGDPYDEDDLYSDAFRNNRLSSSSREVGSNLKVRQWNQNEFPPLEKNFYVQSDSVSQRSQSEVDEFYRAHNIQAVRGDMPRPIMNFDEANFPERIGEQLERNGCTKPTPIQSIGWPLALSGKNMVGIAQTGSGKTLGFILPALIHVKHQRRVSPSGGEGPVVLVLAPTRELAQQIKSVAVEYGRLLGIRSCSIFGGQSKFVQAKYLSEGPEIVVATPGRLLDFLEMDVINLERTSYVVLDEADRMLDMGFEPQIRRVLSQIRPDRQMLMWSATWPKEIRRLAHDFLEEFTQVNIGSMELMANPNIEQIVKICNRREKLKLLVKELESSSEKGDPPKTLVFAQTKDIADLITHKLRKLRFRALAIHGDKSQLVRDKTLNSFRQGETQILVATNVAARGLDMDDIKQVINFDYPMTVDDYIHRIGRTARASKTGRAITFFTPDDASRADDLIKVLEDAKQEVPFDLRDLASIKTKFKKGLYKRNSW